MRKRGRKHKKVCQLSFLLLVYVWLTLNYTELGASNAERRTSRWLHRVLGQGLRCRVK